MHPIRRRPCADPVQKQVPGDSDDEKGLTYRGPLQKPGLNEVKSGERTCGLHRCPPGIAEPVIGPAIGQDPLAHPGYEDKKQRRRMRNAGRCIRYEPRHANECCHSPARGTPPRWRGGDPVSGVTRPQAGTAHLPAFRNGAHGSEPTPPLSSRRTSWDGAENAGVACLRLSQSSDKVADRS